MVISILTKDRISIDSIGTLFLLCIVLVISLTSEQFTGTESSGLVEVMAMMEGGTSTSPISVIVTPSERSPISATGKEYIGRYDV